MVPESPYWLDSRQMYADLEKMLRKMATINKRSGDNWLPQYKFTVSFITKPDPLVSTIVAQIGKFAISGTISVSWTYVPE